jgi:hypothetical protein
LPTWRGDGLANRSDRPNAGHQPEHVSDVQPVHDSAAAWRELGLRANFGKAVNRFAYTTPRRYGSHSASDFETRFSGILWAMVADDLLRSFAAIAQGPDPDLAVRR